jgi:hypothetical protein
MNQAIPKKVRVGFLKAAAFDFDLIQPASFLTSGEVAGTGNTTSTNFEKEGHIT